MIGFALRVMTFGMGGSGSMCVGVCGLVAGIFAMCGIAKCCSACARCRMRNCGCFKWCLRKTGTDSYDDFEALILIHEVTFTMKGKKHTIFVRVTAGDHKVETEENKQGIFQQPLAVCIEQGTPAVKIEVVRQSTSQVLATLKLDPVQDILRSSKTHSPCEAFTMKQKQKDIMNPKITLTIKKDAQKELAKGAMLVQGMGVSKETGFVLQNQIDQLVPDSTSADEGASAEIDLLSRGSSGPLMLFGSWGSTTKVYVAVKYHPAERRYKLGVWKDREDYERGVAPKYDIDLLKVFSVSADPKRKEVFIIEYAPKDKERKRLLFQRMELTRDAWVEILTLLIKSVRQHRDKQKKSPSILPPGGVSFQASSSMRPYRDEISLK